MQRDFTATPFRAASSDTGYSSGMDESTAREIVICGHEAAHAVAAVRLAVAFDYVTLDDAEFRAAPFRPVDNSPRAIPFYGPDRVCCRKPDVMCADCRAEEERAESLMLVAISGSLGAAASGCSTFGYGHEADKAYVTGFCKVAFAESDAKLDRRVEKAAGTSARTDAARERHRDGGGERTEKAKASDGDGSQTHRGQQAALEGG